MGKIQFIRCPKECRTQHQNILFIPRKRRLQPMNKQDKEQQEIGKKLNLINLEEFLKYIQLFIYLFNKKKFEKLLE